MKTQTILVVLISSIVFSKCQRNFEKIVNKAMCMLNCDFDIHCVQNCTEFPQTIKKLDDEAGANATLVCQEVQYIVLAHNPGIFVIDSRIIVNGSWSSSVISTETRKTLIGREDTLYQYRFHRVFPDGISKPETTGWFHTMSNTHRPKEVTYMSEPIVGIEPQDPTHLTAEFTFAPAEDRSCFYEVIYREDNNRVLTKTLEQPLDYRVKFSPLNFDTKYTIHLMPYTQRIIEGPVTEMIFTTPSCLDYHGDLTICAPPMVRDLNATEIPKTGNVFDVEVTWRLPTLIPDYYTVSLFPIAAVVHGPITRNVSGNVTSTIFENVRIIEQYDVTIFASSSAGDGEQMFDRFTISERNERTDNVTEINSNGATTSVGTVVIVFLAVVVLLGCFGFYVYRKREKRDRTKKRAEYFESLDRTDDAAIDAIKVVGEFESVSEMGDVESVMTPADEYEIRQDRLKIKRVLGKGAFGVVRLGSLRDDRGQFTEVAVKMLRDDPKEADLRNFELEIKMMKSAGQHPNIVSLIGCCTACPRPLLIVEYCSRGDLQTFLRAIWEKTNTDTKKRPFSKSEFGERNDVLGDNRDDSLSTSHSSSEDGVNFPGFVANRAYDLDLSNFADTDKVTETDLLNFGRQIATGMEFLSSNRVVHRDLAARNVLVCDDRTVKISDFGLSRDIYQENVYKKRGNGRVPVKWMAIESLTHQVYTTCSDVWSFGILLWEIVTFGSSPYPDTPATGVLKRLRSGYRLERPSSCGEPLYQVMRSCWELNPRDRPTFTVLRRKLDKLISTTTENDYLDLNDASRGSTAEDKKLETTNSSPVYFPRRLGYVNQVETKAISDGK